MKNPLNKRLLRELKTDFKKYTALFLLLVLTIGAISGLFVANNSMENELNKSYEKYNIEDGHFEFKDEPAPELLEDIEKEGISIYKQYYKDFIEDYDGDGAKDADIRVFVIRESVNKICIMEGALPTGDNEIAIDRMHADNMGLKVGDTIRLDDYEMKITGLVALSDYSTLYKNSTDTMFDALTFNIGVVTQSAYDKLNAKEAYQYAFKYDKAPADTNEQKEMSDELVKRIGAITLTGGMFNDADEAEAFEDKINLMTDELEGIKEQADELEARQKELMSKTDATMDELAALKKDAEDFEPLAKRAEELLDELEGYEDEWEMYEPYQNELTDYVPEYANQAIHFAPNDMGSDKAMGEVLLIVLVGVLAFIFAITASNTITNEASAIGTLRASGYTKGELIRHYMTMPVIVTLISAIIGNILGYTVLKNVVVSMYYNSYSLPTYVTVWNADAFVKTTVYPIILMIIVNAVVISYKLRLSPLRFLRHDLGSSRKKRAVRLPEWKFLNRFRMRIFFQNIAGYIVLFIGIFFVNVLLGFAIGLPSTLKNYQADAAKFILADYQYVLKDTKDKDGNELVTKNPSAEHYSILTLEAITGPHIGEKISVYGYEDNSSYFNIDKDLTGKEIYVTDGFAAKFSLEEGDEISLKEEYSDKTYDFDIVGIYELPGTVGVLMPNESFNVIFEKDEGSFSGFLTGSEITYIDEDMIATVVTLDDVVKIAKQLDHSMGNYMNYFAAICFLMAILIIYLLTKIIIERSAVSISMVKVLGYTNKEINGLYIRITSIIVVVSALLGAYLSKFVLSAVWVNVMNELNGWFEFLSTPVDMLKMAAITIGAYIVVLFFDMRRIRRIPMTEALKNVE